MQEWEDTGAIPDQIKLWSLEDINDLNNSIYYDVAAVYLEDLSQSLPDYFLDPKNLLVDCQYSTKLEERYLQHVAQKHQEKNESNSKKLQERITDVQEILRKDSEADKNLIVRSHPVTVSMLNERRQKEEDAK